jgi:hypothetical protein
MSRVELNWVEFKLGSWKFESSRAELMKRFELKNLAQTRLVTIRTSLWASSRVNVCVLIQFDI